MLADGSLAVSNGGDSVMVYVTDANGNEAPLRTISGLNTGLHNPYGLAVLADGSLAVANNYFDPSVTVYAMPPGAPTGLSATPGDGQAIIAFTAPASDGGAAITDYEYQLDSGSWVSAGTTSSPVTIISLTNGSTYSVKLRAVNSAGAGTASSPVDVIPVDAARTPSFDAPVATADGFTVNVTNYDPAWTWTPSSTAGTVTAGTPAGTTLPLTVTGLTAGGAATVTVSTGRSGYAGGTGDVSGTALAAYSVTYNGNGNSGGAAPTDPSSPYASGATVTVLGNTGNLVKTSYTFNGWNTAADGSGTSYAPGATFTINADTTLYAQWSALTATTTTLTSSLNPSTVGASVTFTATVAAAPQDASVARLSQGLIGNLGGGGPTGNVEFFDSSTSLGSSALNGAGQATLPTSDLTQGTHSITAVYAGDASYQTSTSTALSQVVNAVPAISPASQTITGQLAMPFTTMAYTPSGFSGAVSYTISPTNLPPGLSFQSTTGVLSGTPTQTQTNATFTVTATDGTSGTATATINITILATQATGTTPGGPVTATITGGNCLGFQNGSAQFTVPIPPAGQTLPYGVFGFTVLQCGQGSQGSQGSQGAQGSQGGTVTITLRYPQPLPEGTRYWKYIDGNWVDWTSKVTITGNTVVLTITDDGEGDTNRNPGEISDPSGPGLNPTPIPTLSQWALLLLGGLLVAFGWQHRQRRSLR